MTVINREEGGLWAHGLGWCDTKDGGKAVSMTVYMSKKELGYLKRWLRKHKGRTGPVTQCDADGLLLACMSAGLDCWLIEHGFTKNLGKGADDFRRDYMKRGKK